MCGKGTNRTHCEHSSAQDGHLFPLVPLVIQSFFTHEPESNIWSQFDFWNRSLSGWGADMQRWCVCLEIGFLWLTGQIGKHKSKEVSLPLLWLKWAPVVSRDSRGFGKKGCIVIVFFPSWVTQNLAREDEEQLWAQTNWDESVFLIPHRIASVRTGEVSVKTGSTGVRNITGCFMRSESK